MRPMIVFFVVTCMTAGVGLAQQPEPNPEAAAQPVVVAPASPCDTQAMASLLSLALDLNPVNPNCPGSRENCVDTFCAFLTGAQRAQCIATCGQAPVCGECICRCGANCTRTCTQRCCRTTEGPPFRQICCTRSCFKFPDELAPPD